MKRKNISVSMGVWINSGGKTRRRKKFSAKGGERRTGGRRVKIQTEGNSVRIKERCRRGGGGLPTTTEIREEGQRERLSKRRFLGGKILSLSNPLGKGKT